MVFLRRAASALGARARELARSTPTSTRVVAVTVAVAMLFTVVATTWRMRPFVLALVYGALLFLGSIAAFIRLRVDRRVLGVLIGGLVLYIVYWSYTSYDERNYDCSVQVQYMDYLIKHHSRPPPGQCLVCHHPPLYYAIGAVVYSFFRATKLMSPTAGLQALSLVFFLVFLGFAVKTIERLTPDRRLRTLASALVVFWPYSVQMSVRVHNDALVSMLMSAALYFMLRWYQEDRPRDLYLALLAILLSVFTKSSGYVFAGVLLVLMVRRFLQRRDRLLQLKRGAIVLFALLGVASLNVIGKSRAADAASDRRWFCHKVLGNACDFHPKVLVENDPYNYVYFDLQNFVQEPYVIADRDGTGRQLFWNHLLKSSLFATHNAVPDRETSYEVNRRLATLLNALLVGMVAYMTVGIAAVKTRALKPFAVPILAVASSVLFMVGFRVLVPWPHHVDFRHIFPVVVPTSIFYALTVGHFRRRGLVLAHVGRAMAIAFVFLSVVYFIPKQKVLTHWTTHPIELDLASRSKVVAEGTPWDRESNLVFEATHVLAFKVGKPETVAGLDATFDGNDVYEITLYGEGEPRRIRVGPGPKSKKGLVRYTPVVDPPVVDVTKVEVRAVSGDLAYALGHLILKGPDDP